MKKSSKVYLGFDLGASSGRAILGFLDKGKLRIEELHRFTNGPVQMGQTLYWDFLYLWSNMLESLRMCARRGYTRLGGIGIDTWGVDFGLIGRDGRLLSNPVHYRDDRTAGVEEIIAKKISNKKIYQLTGLGIGRIRTYSQLVAMRKGPQRYLLDNAKTILQMPDLLRYFLCGDRASELATTGSSQLVDVRTRKWSKPLFDAFDIPMSMLAKIVTPGRVRGQLLPDICRETGIVDAPVIAAAGHDTASAAAAVPFGGPDTVFVSCGTWSVMGIVNDEPITSEAALQADFINEFGVDSMMVVRNLVGLYLTENLRRAWMKKGQELSYRQMVEEADKAKPFQMIIDSNAPIFFSPVDTEKQIETYLRQTRQKKVAGRGALIRAILEGLAFNFRQTVIEIEKITGRKMKRFCVIGGGAHNTLLCQMAADATGLEVIAGPTEATAAGNLGIQALATGELAKPSDIQTLMQNSFKLVTYTPQQTAEWDRHFDVYNRIVAKSSKIK